MQLRDLAAQHGKAGAGQFGTGLEIEAQRAADIDVVLDFEVERARRAPAAGFHVAAFVGAGRHRFVWQVGDGQQPVVDAVLYRGEGFFCGLQLVTQ